MKSIFRISVVLCIFLSLISCDELLPVNYDKAGRDLMALMRGDASVTISDFNNSLTMGISSKDFFTMMKTDPSVNQMVQLLSLDMMSNRAKELGVDVKNLQRALSR